MPSRQSQDNSRQGLNTARSDPGKPRPAGRLPRPQPLRTASPGAHAGLHQGGDRREGLRRACSRTAAGGATPGSRPCVQPAEVHRLGSLLAQHVRLRGAKGPDPASASAAPGDKPSAVGHDPWKAMVAARAVASSEYLRTTRTEEPREAEVGRKENTPN